MAAPLSQRAEDLCYGSPAFRNTKNQITANLGKRKLCTIAHSYFAQRSGRVIRGAAAGHKKRRLMLQKLPEFTFTRIKVRFSDSAIPATIHMRDLVAPFANHKVRLLGFVKTVPNIQHERLATSLTGRLDY